MTQDEIDTLERLVYTDVCRQIKEAKSVPIDSLWAYVIITLKMFLSEEQLTELSHYGDYSGLKNRIETRVMARMGEYLT
jgi:hypothetical protein